jgi:hypothetical protein
VRGHCQMLLTMLTVDRSTVRIHVEGQHVAKSRLSAVPVTWPRRLRSHSTGFPMR